MMRLPRQKALPRSRDRCDVFLGLNRTLGARDNEFTAMTNGSARRYPAFAARAPRGRVRAFTATPRGLLGGDSLIWADGTTLCDQGTAVGTVADSDKQFVRMGADVLIFPDKLRYRPATGELASLSHAFTTARTVAFSLCGEDGASLGAYTTAATAPTAPSEGALWLDTSASPYALKRYSAEREAFETVPLTHVRIGATGIGAGFAAGDGVTISGCECAALNGDAVLTAVGADFIALAGMLDAGASQQDAVTVARTVPDMDFVVCADNRLWGCSSAAREIYASKLGDPTNFRVYEGLATDSYAVTVASSGAFTGACAFLSHVLFFKENLICKLYGSKPANYQLSFLNVRGVMAGCSRSLAAVGERLFYKSRDGVMCYEGGVPVCVSDALGRDVFDDAVAGAHAGSYCVSLRVRADAYGAEETTLAEALRADGLCADAEPLTRHFFRYDARRGLWHREDGTQALFFAEAHGDTFFAAGDGVLYTLGATIDRYADADAAIEDALPWSLETVDFGLRQADRRYVSQLQLRMLGESDADVTVAARYDSDGDWQTLWTGRFGDRRAHVVPLKPRRCDHLRLRVSGTGAVTLYAMTKVTEAGGM